MIRAGYSPLQARIANKWQISMAPTSGIASSKPKLLRSPFTSHPESMGRHNAIIYLIDVIMVVGLARFSWM